MDSEIELFIIKNIKQELKNTLEDFFLNREHSCPQSARILTLEMGNHGVLAEMNKIHIAVKDSSLLMQAMIESHRKEQKESMQNLHRRIDKMDLALFLSVITVILGIFYFLVPRIKF